MCSLQKRKKITWQRNNSFCILKIYEFFVFHELLSLVIHCWRGSPCKKWWMHLLFVFLNFPFFKWGKLCCKQIFVLRGNFRVPFSMDNFISHYKEIFNVLHTWKYNAKMHNNNVVWYVIMENIISFMFFP